MSTIISTNYENPQAVISNGQTTGVGWSNPEEILTINELFAESSPGGASDIIVGNFLANVPQDAVVTGIAFKIRGYQGALSTPPTTVQFYAVDNTSGSDVFIPYTAPFTGLTPEAEYYDFGGSTYLFNQTWTPDQINNFKLQLITNGDVYIDSVMLKVFYYIPTATVAPIDTGTNCADCNSPIQALPFTLALPFNIGDTQATFRSFTYPNGESIQPEDVGACGGYVDFVFDPGVQAGNGNNFEENARCPATWTFNSNGTVTIDFVSVNNRGLDFKTPFGHSADNMSDHDAGSTVIISNSGPFYTRFLRRCEKGTTYSAPIAIEDENVEVNSAVETINFAGSGVIVSQDLSDDKKVNITIPGAGSVTPPVAVGVGSGTTGSVKASTLTYVLPISGINRGAKIDVNISDEATITGVTVGGVAATRKTTITANDVVQEQWFLTAPALGNQNVVITLSGDAYIVSGGVCLVGVNQSASTGATDTSSGSGTAVSDTLATTADNSIVLDTVGTADAPLIFTKGTGMSQIWQRSLATDLVEGAGAYQPSGNSPDNVVMAWTISKTTGWVHSMLEVIGITSGGSGDQSGITFEDEGTPLGTSGTVTEVDFTGPGVNASRTGNKVTVNIPGGSGSGEALEYSVTQTAHGLSVGDVIKSSGTDDEYAKAQADSAVNAEVVGIVTTVTDANNFIYSKDIMGYAGAGIPAGTAGVAIFLSPTTAGLMTVTEPTTPGQISKPVGVLIASGAKMNFTSDYRGQDVQSTAIGTAVYTNGTTTKNAADASATQTIAHGLGVIPSKVTINASESVGASGNEVLFTAEAIYNGTTQSSQSNYRDSFVGAVSDNTFSLNSANATGAYTRGVVTFDATNIYIAWTKTGSPTGTYQILWEAESVQGALGATGSFSAIGTGTASSTQTISHSLGYTPNKITLKTSYIGSSSAGGAGHVSSYGFATSAADQKYQNFTVGQGSGGAVDPQGSGQLFNGNEGFSTNTCTLANVTSTTLDLVWVNGTTCKYILIVE